MSESASDAVNDAIARTVGIVGLGGIALIHALQVPEAFEETVYLGVLFIGAILASLALTTVLTRTSDQRAWVAAGGLAAAIMLGYVLTRTSGLPDATLDVGNWTEPLGLASLVAEGLVLCVTAGVLAARGVVPGRAPAQRRTRSQALAGRTQQEATR
jgi:membrane protease YdiL (CAAX protease family)